MKISKSTFVIAILGLVASGCGSDDSNVDDTAPSTTRAAVSTTAPEATTTTTHSDDHQMTTTTTDTNVSDDVRIVEVSMTEFAFEPERVDISAGETVRFIITNNGAIDHEFRLSNAHRIEEHLESGHDDHGEGGHHEEDGDVFVELEPGATGEITVTFPKDMGIYTEIACLLPGHYEAGMLGELTYSDA